jgi:predicted dehydrogenase
MRPTRRSFLSSSLAATVALGGTGRVLGANDRIGVAVVGVNGMGHGHVRALAGRQDARVVALCDVDQAVLARAAKTVKDAAGEDPSLVEDFRKLLDDRAVDAVVIATPHHWHCPVALAALQAGKDVYVEKPASHVFREGRLLVEAARKYRRVVQHGTQMRSSPVTDEAGRVLKSGLLGEVKIAKAWNVQDRGVQAPVPDGDPPRGVNYDRWLGPAPRRPFNRNRFHHQWRLVRDYGNGDLGDDGAHDLDLARWGLGVTTHPVRITAHGSNVRPPGYREFPDNMMVAYEYPDGKVLVYEDRLFTPYGLHGFDSGNAFYGTKGYMIFSRRGYFQVYLGPKEEKGPAMGKSGRVGAPVPTHLENFLACVRSRKEPKAGPEVAHLSCALIHLGEIAYRTRTVLELDSNEEKIVNSKAANAMLTKEYRAPYGLPKTI